MKQEFINVIEKHQGIIYKVARMYRDSKQDQEDLFQDIVLQLWKSYPGFKGESKVGTWMYRIALNTAIAVYRENRVKIEFKQNPPDILSISQVDEISENEEKMFAAFRTLNQADRSILALYLDDYSYHEIGEITGITEQYVAVKISRIKVKLKNKLNKL